MARPKTLPPQRQATPDDTAFLAVMDSILNQPPIPGPKGWSDDVERAAIAKALQASPPSTALIASGVAPGTATYWLSDDPPEQYKSACHALATRLKCAEDACASDLFQRIQRASTDPKHWTAAAWILERRHGFVVKQTQQDGPSIVVNIGQVNVSANRQLRDAVTEVIDAVPLLEDGRKSEA